MEFLGVGPLELFLILLLVVLLFNPKDIIGGARMVGKNLQKIYRSDTYRVVKQASDEIRELPSRLAKESELEDLQQIHQEIQQGLKGENSTAKEITPEREKPAE
jgi:Sec-independent protein translocase protein TatA